MTTTTILVFMFMIFFLVISFMFKYVGEEKEDNKKKEGDLKGEELERNLNNKLKDDSED